MDFYHKLDKEISNKKNNKSRKSITIGRLISIIEQNKTSHWLLLFFVTPLMMPIPLPPGVVTIFTIPLFVLVLQMTINNDKIYIPNFIRKIKINIGILNIYHQKIGKRINKLQSFSKKRLLFVVRNQIFKKFTRFNIIALTMLCLIIPVPMLNIIPATCIMIILFGEILSDGLFVLIGISMANITFVLLYFITRFIQDIAYKFLLY